MEVTESSIPVRRAFLSLLYEGKDISAQIAPYVLSFSYTDNAHGKADDLQVSLEDREQLWKGDWYPEKGAKLTASIRCENWESPTAAPKVMSCGTFTIDEIEFSGVPDTVSIKAISAAVTTSLRQQKKSKAWENASLKQVAQDIANKHGLALKYDGPDLKFRRMDQRETSDLGFLKRMAEQRGMRLKVAEDTIILMHGKSYDAKTPVKTLTRGSSAIKSYHFKQKTDDVYGDGAEVAYHDPESKSDKKHTFTGALSGEQQEFVSGSAKKKGGDKLKINRRLDPLDDGIDMVAAEARDKNQDEFEGGLTLMGDLDFRAAMTVAVSGFKKFDATYCIETAVHAVDRRAGYTTDITLRKALGY